MYNKKDDYDVRDSIKSSFVNLIRIGEVLSWIINRESKTVGLYKEVGESVSGEVELPIEVEGMSVLGNFLSYEEGREQICVTCFELGIVLKSKIVFS